MSERTRRLIIVEGEDTEPKFFKSLQKSGLLGEHSNLHDIAVFGTDIYQLWQEISKDEDVDLYGLLREKDKLPDALERNNIAEIFLFFDYDPHATMANDRNIEKMLELFDIEDDYGQLYISYPMFEAFRHIPKDRKMFYTLEHQIVDGSRYKSRVNKESDHCFKDHRKLDRENWVSIVQLHCAQAAKLTQLNDKIPTQQKIFQAQLRRLKEAAVITVLGSIPLFIACHHSSELKAHLNTISPIKNHE